MNNRILGILGSVGAAVAFAGLNFVSTIGADWSFAIIAGAVWGLLSGLFIAFVGNKWPIIAGAVVSLIFFGLVALLISEIPGGIVTTSNAVIVAVVKVLALGAFTGFGYKLAILSRPPAAQ